MKSRIAVAAGALVALSLATGAVLERAVDRDAPRAAALAGEVERLRGRESVLAAERARLRAERNRLEARLAASRQAPVCAAAYVSTAEAATPAPYAFDYPCSWHVLHDRVERIEAPEREGLQVSITLVSQFPITLIPREGPLTEIEVADWSATGERDGLPPLEEWIADERAAFTGEVDETRFEAGAGMTVTSLAGTREVSEQPFPTLVLLWGYIDPLSGARHIVQVTSFGPSAQVRAAMERLARTFVVREV